MSGDSEVMSERTLSIRMGSDDNQTSHSRLVYMLNGSSIFKKESASNPFSGEASPFGRHPREVVLSDD